MMACRQDILDAIPIYKSTWATIWRINEGHKHGFRKTNLETTTIVRVEADGT